jgi:hypothetical protein
MACLGSTSPSLGTSRYALAWYVSREQVRTTRELANDALQQTGELWKLAALAFYFVRPQLNLGVIRRRPRRCELPFSFVLVGASSRVT